MEAPFLQQGDGGPAVSALQFALAALGFDVGVVDGIFGEQTQAAVRQFQENQGIDATGTADEGTWQALGGQPFTPDERTQLSAQEFPSIARAIFFANDIDGYLADLGIDPASIDDDEEPNT
jgi:peptidoglycan hydrolase-like protein with peptidoglycan-binding domain